MSMNYGAYGTRLNGGMPARAGLQQQRVTVLSVDSNGNAMVIDKFQNYYPPISIYNIVGSGSYPQRGEDWMISKDNGNWTFRSKVIPNPPVINSLATLISALQSLGFTPSSSVLPEPVYFGGYASAPTTWAATSWQSVTQFPSVTVEKQLSGTNLFVDLKESNYVTAAGTVHFGVSIAETGQPTQQIEVRQFKFSAINDHRQMAYQAELTGLGAGTYTLNPLVKTDGTATWAIDTTDWYGGYILETW